MARASDQVRSSDVTFWGLVALACGGLAVLSANVSAVIPQGLLAGLHASRLDGGTLSQLRTQVASLESESARLARENAGLVARFNMAEEGDGVLARRIGAVEVALPNVLESSRDLNSADITASIGTAGGTSYPTDGGSVSVQRTPLAPSSTAPMSAEPAMPPLAASFPEPDTNAIGVAIGPVVDASDAPALWRGLNSKVGALLIGLGPVLAETTDGKGKQLVAGPLNGPAQATALCTKLALVGIACSTAPYAGAALPN